MWRAYGGRMSVEENRLTNLRADAESLAAVAAGVSREQARAVISEYLTRIARCQVCGDTGRFRFDLPLTMRIAETGSAMKANVGDETDCPRCGPPVDGSGAGNPSFVRWYCANYKTVNACRAARTDGDPDHAGCGPRIMLPFERRDA